jgi:hypothetical protein
LFIKEKGIETIMTDNFKLIARKAIRGTRIAAWAAPDDAKADADSRFTTTQEIFKDAFGFTYHSVRFCDLDRLCEK